MIQNIRLMKAVVIVLGLVIAIGMGALLVAMGRLGGGPGGEAGTGALALDRIALPEGARVLDMDIDGGRIALRLLLSGGGEEIAVYDLETGARLGSIPLTP